MVVQNVSLVILSTSPKSVKTIHAGVHFHLTPQCIHRLPNITAPCVIASLCNLSRDEPTQQRQCADSLKDVPEDL